MYLEEKSSYNKNGTFNSECLPIFWLVWHYLTIVSIFMTIIIKTIVIKMNHIRFKILIIKFLFFIWSPPSFGQSPRLAVDTQNILFHRNYYINLTYISQYKNKHFFVLKKSIKNDIMYLEEKSSYNKMEHSILNVYQNF